MTGWYNRSPCAPSMYPFVKFMFCFNVDILAKVIFKEGLKENGEGALQLYAGNISHAENASSGLKTDQVGT